MRVLSFFPAVLLAAASFVAAAPTATSCVPSTGNDAALQPIIAIFADATAQIQPLNDQLSGQSGNPDAKAVDAIVVKITAVVQATVGKLEAAPKVELSSLDLTNLGAAIYAHIALIVNVLNVVIAIVIKLGRVAASLQTDITALLRVIITLVGSLHIFVAASLAVVLGPIIVLVTGSVNLLVTIVARLDVIAAVGV